GEDAMQTNLLLQLLISWMVVSNPGIAEGHHDDSRPQPLGIRVSDFTLPDVVRIAPWVLANETRDAKATVVLFLSAQCPVSMAYAPTLEKLHQQYTKKGVTFVAIFSHLDEDAGAVAQHAKDFKLPFPALKDEGTKLADRFAVERLPTAYVLDSTRLVR